MSDRFQPRRGTELRNRTRNPASRERVAATIERSVAASQGSVSPWLTLWLPFAGLSAFAAWRYISACFTLKNDGIDAFMDRIGDGISSLRHRLFRRFGWEVSS
mgnify:CR=1 FL=1